MIKRRKGCSVAEQLTRFVALPRGSLPANTLRVFFFKRQEGTIALQAAQQLQKSLQKPPAPKSSESLEPGRSEKQVLARMLRAVHGNAMDLLPVSLRHPVASDEGARRLSTAHPELFQYNVGAGGLCLSHALQRLWEQLVECVLRHPTWELLPSVLEQFCQGDAVLMSVAEKLGGVTGLVEAFGTALMLKERTLPGGEIQRYLILKPFFMQLVYKLPIAAASCPWPPTPHGGVSAVAAGQSQEPAHMEAVAKLSCHALARLVSEAHARTALSESFVGEVLGHHSAGGGVKLLAAAHPDLFSCSNVGGRTTLRLSSLLQQLWGHMAERFQHCPELHVGPLIADLYNADQRFKGVIKKLGGGTGLSEAFSKLLILQHRAIGADAVQQLFVLRGSRSAVAEASRDHPKHDYVLNPRDGSFINTPADLLSNMQRGLECPPSSSLPLGKGLQSVSAAEPLNQTGTHEAEGLDPDPNYFERLEEAKRQWSSVCEFQIQGWPGEDPGHLHPVQEHPARGYLPERDRLLATPIKVTRDVSTGAVFCSASGSHRAEPAPNGAGWEPYVDPGSGRAWWWHSATGACVWDDPTSEDEGCADMVARNVHSL